MKIFAKENQEKGVSLVITFFIMVIILAVIVSVSALLYSELKIIRNIGRSVVAFYAADSGVEKVLYYDRKVKPKLGEDQIAERGLCSMFDYNPTDNPGACQVKDGPGDIRDDSIFCNAKSVTPLSDGGCNPEKCDNCRIEFDTVFDGTKGYHVTATVSPSLDGSTSNFDIESKGYFNDVFRQVNTKTSKTEEGAAFRIDNASVQPRSVPAGLFSFEIFAEVSTTITNDKISHVRANVYTDSDSSVYLVDLFCITESTTGDCTKRGTFSGSRLADKVGAYYITITAENNSPDPITKNIVQGTEGLAFEVYPASGTPYPTVTDVAVVPSDGNSMVITADVYDISGVSSVQLTVWDSNTKEKVHEGSMVQIVGNSFASEVIYVANFSGEYTVDIYATDNFFNDSGDIYTDMQL